MRNYLVLLYIVCMFSVFFLTPISIFADIYIHIFSLLGFVSFFTSKLYKVSILKFTFLTVSTLLLLSIFSSISYLKQDVFSAIIATQYLIKGFSIIYIYKLYISRKIDLDKIFKYLITTIWIFTVFLVIATLTEFSFTFISPISGQQLEITARKYSKDLFSLNLMSKEIQDFEKEVNSIDEIKEWSKKIVKIKEIKDKIVNEIKKMNELLENLNSNEIKQIIDYFYLRHVHLWFIQFNNN